MQHTKTVSIGSDDYVLTHLSPTKAFAVLTKLLKYFGQSMGAGLADLSIENLEKLQDLDIKIPDMVKTITANLDTKEAHDLMRELIEPISHEGVMLKGQHFEAHFMGKISRIFQLLVEQVKFQFEDFFVEVVGLMSKIPATKKKLSSQDPQTSAGQSGESSSKGSQLSRKLSASGI